MQASKIKPHEVYAIKAPDDRLVRFRVTAVITRRVSNHGNPHDYQSSVEGFIQAQDANNGGKPSEPLTLDPTTILGLYTDHVELVARESAERAERKRIEDDKAEKRERLVAALYEASGIERPDTTHRYVRTPFYQSGSGIDITADAVEPLLAFFERIKANA
jgi:hypothetical protein